MPAAPGTCPMDRTCLGIALLDRAIALGAQLSPGWLPPSNAVGPRTPSRMAGAPLVVGVGTGRGGRHTYAAREWLDAVQPAVCVSIRLRLDAALYEPTPLAPEQTLTHFMRCWQMETQNLSHYRPVHSFLNLRILRPRLTWVSRDQKFSYWRGRGGLHPPMPFSVMFHVDVPRRYARR